MLNWDKLAVKSIQVTLAHLFDGLQIGEGGGGGGGKRGYFAWIGFNNISLYSLPDLCLFFQKMLF